MFTLLDIMLQLINTVVLQLPSSEQLGTVKEAKTKHYD